MGWLIVWLGCTQPTNPVEDTASTAPVTDTDLESPPPQSTPPLPAGEDRFCGDTICQDHEDPTLCPWDCVPYLVDDRAPEPACDRVYSGMIPLTDLGSDRFVGVAEGGLYPGGSNVRPPAHEAAGLAAAADIAPIDGKICVMSVGMSNTGQKWSSFMDRAPDIPGMDPAITLAQGAVGSHPVDTTADPDHNVWNIMASQLAEVGCALDTVQVAWILHAERGPKGTFETSQTVFLDHLRSTVLNLADKAPSLRMIYLSSRVYAGYGTRNNNPEPYAYQSAFAVKDLIVRQIEGTDPALAQDAGVPWLSWGPYLWADGLGPDGVEGGIPGRQEPADGLEYACEDFSTNDGIHPGPGSRQKVTHQLEAFFLDDPTASPWFRD